MKMRRKIFTNMLLLSLITLILTATLFSYAFYQQLEENTNRELKHSMGITAAGYSNGGIEYLQSIKGLDRYSRITLVDRDGSVLFDNRANFEMMENHLTRPEIKEAFSNGKGQSTRLSGTLDRQYFYFAQLMDDGTVLRLSTSTESLVKSLTENIPATLGILFLIILISIFVARMLTRSIIKPINEIDMENPYHDDLYEEIAPLITKIRRLDNSAYFHMEELVERSKNFSNITTHMKEGLMIIDKDGKIISLNKSALVFFDVKDLDFEGKHYSYINRGIPLHNAVETALTGNFWNHTVAKNELSFLIQSTPVTRNEQVTGVILMVFDITEQRKSELVRKEFTANVSHELKTPLTAIIGYAEIIKNRMAMGEDTVDFAGRIYDEANGLLSLIEDIIQLSKLDEEHDDPEMEEIDLLAAASSLVSRLQTIAEKKEVTLRIEGNGGVIKGNSSMIEELLLNLCDNAIKYNKAGGDVLLSVNKFGKSVQLQVKDTGIGIPLEYQERVFERFYRVDKSHSKTTGGTGLGLSIVKHIVAIHHASITLNSTLGKGTSIVITFDR